MSLKYFYSFNGADWFNASIVSETGLLQPDSYNGILQNVKWLSTRDLGNVDVKNVLFEIVVSDNAAGKADPISLNVDNWHNQSISVVFPSTAQTGKVAIHYTISDTTKDTLRIYPYYCKEGTSWRSATTIESPVITAGNYEGQITWSSVADAGAVSSKVRFKIEISDNWGFGKSDSTDLFLLENSMIPFIVQAKNIPSVSSDTNHTVNTAFTIERINKGTIAIKSAFFRTGGEWKEIKSLSGYEIGDTSQNPVVSWQSRSDYTDNSDSVFMKFVFKMNLYEVDVIAGPFTLENNYRSAIKIDPITSKQHGDIGMSYTISDKDFDPQELIPQYRLSTDSKWKIATVNNSAGIDSAHFKGEIIWKSYSDIPLIENIAVLFKLTTVDQDTGIADSVQFVVSNQGLPVCEKLTIMDSVYKDTITLSYKLYDANNDTLSICMYYYFNGDWKKCKLITGDTTNISPEKYSGIIQWVSKSDFENVTSPGIKLKLLPKDSIYGAACETDTFTINNFDPFLNLVGDFNSDKRVDFLDFNYCALYWYYSARGEDNPDSIGDIGPATGSAPNLTIIKDSIFDYKDLSVFIEMYLWSKKNISTKLIKALGKVQASSGKIITAVIETETDSTETIQINANSVQDLLSCMFTVEYDQNEFRYVNNTVNSLMTFGNANPFSIIDTATGHVTICVTRLSSGDLAVDGSGRIINIYFKSLFNNSRKFNITYTLINTRNEVIESGSLAIENQVLSINNKKGIHEGAAVSIIPNPFPSASLSSPLKFLEWDRSVGQLKNQAGGCAILFDPGMLDLKSSELKVKCLIYDYGGNLAKSSEITTLIDLSKKYGIFWDGRNEQNNRVAPGIYKVILKYWSKYKTGKFSLNAGIKNLR